MSDDTLQFADVRYENVGLLNDGLLRLSGGNVAFKSADTGKLTTVSVDDIDEVKWTKLAGKPALKFVLNDGRHLRYGYLKQTDFDKIKAFTQSKWGKELVKEDMSLKGWNYGSADVDGRNLTFNVSGKPAFEMPLSYVSKCDATKSEAVLEFQINEDCPVQLMEMRFFMPNDPEKGDDVDVVEEFRKAVMKYADVEAETEQPLCMLEQVLCATPRGRYDIKVFSTHLGFHGKTYDYKIPYKTITRMFLLPHKDGRQVYFVLQINPPIRQGQTRYPYVVTEIPKDEVVEISLAASDEQLRDQYAGKLEANLNGPTYEVMAKLFRVLVNSRIVVPPNFKGVGAQSPAIACANKANAGYLYTLEKGFIYVYKPPIYIRFEEIDNVHFTRNDASTRSFDFEIVMRNGNVVTFSSIAKEEYNKLFDFTKEKGVKIRNAKRGAETARDAFADSDDEVDPYKEGLKKDAAARAAGGDDDDESDSDEDEDYDVEEDAKKMRAEKSSSEGSGSEPDEEYDSAASDVSDDLIDKPSKKKSDKPAKKKAEKSSKADKDGGKNKRKKKDPNAPKRNQTAFFHWQNENRARIRQEGDSVADTASRAGRMWKEMTDEDKKPYEKKAKEDKERYERDMREYQAKVKSGEIAGPSGLSAPKKNKSPTKASPQKGTKSKEFVEDSDSSDEDEEKKSAKKARKPEKKKPESDEEEEAVASSGEESDAKSTGDSSEESD